MAPLRTPLYAQHVDRDARLTDFAGWEMPVKFASIQEEHAAVRERVGLFDVSHMGQVEIEGSDAEECCQRLVTSNIATLSPGDAQYTTVLREDGTILDDAIIYRRPTSGYLLVPNAGQDALIRNRWQQYADSWELDVTTTNLTDQWGMIAVQGPGAFDAIPAAVSEQPKMTINAVDIAGVECWCARTGYTGERGVELLVPWEQTPTVAAAIDGTWCGLGSRDTLRLEMGYVLAGNEFDGDENRRTPLEAGLDFVVDFGATPAFVGREALRDQQETGTAVHLVGLRVVERGIPRHGYRITDGAGTVIGLVTSGTMSPTLGEPIGLGYVDSEYAETDRDIAVSVRDTEKRASIVTPPFIRSS